MCDCKDEQRSLSSYTDSFWLFGRRKSTNLALPSFLWLLHIKGPWFDYLLILHQRLWKSRIVLFLFNSSVCYQVRYFLLNFSSKTLNIVWQECTKNLGLKDLTKRNFLLVCTTTLKSPKCSYNSSPHPPSMPYFGVYWLAPADSISEILRDSVTDLKRRLNGYISRFSRIQSLLLLEQWLSHQWAVCKVL